MDRLPDGAFVFGIPFQSQVGCHDWRSACERLMHTVGNCLRQNAENVFIVICCHEIPPALAELAAKHDNISIVESPLGPPRAATDYQARVYDMGTKRKRIGVHCGERWGSFGHFMALDGDDLVSRDLVRHVRATAADRGVIFALGYLWDYHDGSIVGLPGAYAPETFDDACGSSGVLFMRAGDFPLSMEDCLPFAGHQDRDRFFANIRGHKVWRDTFDYNGRPYITSPFRDVIYIRHHGANLWNIDSDDVEQSEPPSLPTEQLAAAGELAGKFNLDIATLRSVETAVVTIGIPIPARSNSESQAPMAALRDDAHFRNGDLAAGVAEGAGFVFVPSLALLEDMDQAAGHGSIATSPKQRLLLRLWEGSAGAPSTGETGGFSIRVPDEFESAASAHKVKVSAVARAAGARSARFAIAYSTNDVGNSGWRWFEAAEDWTIFEMTYDVPRMKNGNGDFIGLLPSPFGTPGVEICAVAARVI